MLCVRIEYFGKNLTHLLTYSPKGTSRDEKWDRFDQHTRSLLKLV